MFDALRPIDGADWLRAPTESQIQPPEQFDVVAEMAVLVRLAETKGQIDRASTTWVAVCNWAATELLKTFARQEGADDEKAAALRARARTLRDLLAMNESTQRQVKFADQSVQIP